MFYDYPRVCGYKPSFVTRVNRPWQGCAELGTVVCECNSAIITQIKLKFFTRVRVAQSLPRTSQTNSRSDKANQKMLSLYPPLILNYPTIVWFDE